MTLQSYYNYKNAIWKFRRNLQAAADNNKLFPLIGDKEIAISQSLVDKVRESSDVSDKMKAEATSIHRAFVKFVWTL